ncbi:MAG TPA: hypothetical protein VFZ48_02140 [Candidatus Saccharimonadales bacterium]
MTTPLLPGNPYEVPAHIMAQGGVRFLTTSDMSHAGVTVGAFMHNSPARRGVRLSGGCSGMSRGDKQEMMDYFVEAFANFTGFVSSGGTRQVGDDGGIDPMITDVPAALANKWPDRILTLSTAPRTGQMALVDNSRLVLDAENGTLPQPGVHMVILVQPVLSHDKAGWDFDVDHYLKLFNEYVRTGGWRFGEPVWNGGGITVEEAVKAANLGWPVFPIEGSGRAADQLAAAALAGEPINGLKPGAERNLHVVRRDDPSTLAQAMASQGLIAA